MLGFFDTMTSELVVFVVDGINDAVAEEYKNIAGMSVERDLIVFGVLEKSKRQTCGFDDLCLCALAEILAAGRDRLEVFGNAADDFFD